MQKNQIKAIESFLGGMGVVFVLLGIFTSLEFMLGIIIAMVFWISSGAVSQLLEGEEDGRRSRSISRSKRHRSPNDVTGSNTKAEWSGKSSTSRYCDKCGELIDEDSIFCANCGEKFIQK